MLSIETLKRVAVVYTHAHCPDGMASAMILKDAFRMLGMSPRIEFLTHGTAEHQRAGFLDGEKSDAMSLFCDIAPPKDSAGKLAEEQNTIVLDHHKGVEALVRAFGERGIFADEKLEPGVSGAVLAFREVWLPIADSMFPLKRAGEFQKDREPIGLVGDFALCVGARDTWQTKDNRFRSGQWISKLLMSKPATYWLNERIDRPCLSAGEVEAGRALFEAHEEAVRQAVEQCTETWVGADTEGPSIRLWIFQEQASGFRLTSDVAEALRQRPPHFQAVVAGFSYVIDKHGAEPRLLYSLRGIGGFDVAAFAKANGGGGHTAAAGFSMAIRSHGGVTMTDPYEEVRRRLEAFLICGAGTKS